MKRDAFGVASSERKEGRGGEALARVLVLHTRFVRGESFERQGLMMR